MDEQARLERREIYYGSVVRLSVDKVRLPNGNLADLEVIRHPGAAAIVPITSDRHVLLVRQYRYASGGWLLEVPAGKLDDGEPPEACARREVEEETGHRPGRLDPLGWIFTTPGFTDERIFLFAATDLEPTRQALQHDEVLSVERVPLDDACRWAVEGELRDSKSVCALLRARRFLRGDASK